ncbi:MAG: endonuclease/exonuclease/phosphatase family protein [Burkholderiaceae bacterium]
MPALKIMTFNVQMLPLTAQAVSGQSDIAEQTADRVADAIFGLPATEQPDVIAFNEVFNEDGRAQLLKRLRPVWPAVIDKLWDGVLEDDAGLMLFSRFAFLPLPTGGDRLQRFFGDSAGADSLASKGVGIVQIAAPVGQTTIAFTHLQASYDTEDQYSAIRAKQLDAIHAALEEVIAADPALRGRVIVMGDLNIRGDSGAVSGEWAALFEQGGTQLFAGTLDGWKSYMHPPGATGADEGQTNLDFADTGRRQRLDYICLAKPGVADVVLVPQHMRIRLCNSSDHFALEAVVHVASPHATPADAIDALGIMPNVGGQPAQPSTIRPCALDFRFDGSY